jgi:hypothetical protein
LVERLDIPLRLALHAADVRKDSVEFVELIGGSTRVPAFKARVAEFFNNREGLLSTTLNQDEAVARGCAFQVWPRAAGFAAHTQLTGRCGWGRCLVCDDQPAVQGARLCRQGHELLRHQGRVEDRQ